MSSELSAPAALKEFPSMTWCARPTPPESAEAGDRPAYSSAWAAMARAIEEPLACLEVFAQGMRTRLDPFCQQYRDGGMVDRVVEAAFGVVQEMCLDEQPGRSHGLIRADELRSDIDAAVGAALLLTIVREPC